MSDVPYTPQMPGASVRAGATFEHEHSGLLGWVATVDHKRIGILYLLTSTFFFGVGGIEALLMRIQLARPDNSFLSPGAFNQIFTMHGTTMIFLVAMPALTGMANYLVPLMIGAKDVAFPRLNALSFWLLAFGGLFLYFSFIAGGAPAAGWFSYAPLSEKPYSSSAGVDYYAIGLFVLGIGSIAASINLIVTISAFRAVGLTIRRLPLFVWMVLVTQVLILLALPALNPSLAMLLTFMVQHFLGLIGMPRRVFTYPNLPGWAAFNMTSTIGAVIMGIAVAIFLWNLIVSVVAGKPAGNNPWDAWTLEWATTSPPPPHNFELLPPVRSRRPLWDLAHPEDPDWKHGR